MGKPKFYVVWRGRQVGIFNTWAECQQQVKGFEQAQYKAFESRAVAEEALRMGPSTFLQAKPKATKISLQTAAKPILPSISVDAACSGVPGPMEYRGVDTKTGRQIFHLGPIPDGTNNVGEFLAIVHALALLQRENLPQLPIYSDSMTAIRWVRRGKANTNMVPTPRNTELFRLIQRAELWLQNNVFHNPIIKWDTQAWGEIPADFGRK